MKKNINKRHKKVLKLFEYIKSWKLEFNSYIYHFKEFENYVSKNSKAAILKKWNFKKENLKFIIIHKKINLY